MLQRVIVFGARAVFDDANAKATGFEQACEGGARVMTEMMRQGEAVPIFPEMASLITAEIRQADQRQSTGTQKPVGLLQFGTRIGQVFERIPETYDVECG